VPPTATNVGRVQFRPDFLLQDTNGKFSQQTMDEFDLNPSDFKGPRIAIKNHLKMNKFQANNFLSVKEQHYCHNVMSNYEK
jgi:hypothetical protein